MTYRPYPDADRALPGPSLDELRATGVDAQVARMRTEMDRVLASTWRGRVVRWLTRWAAARPGPGSSR